MVGTRCAHGTERFEIGLSLLVGAFMFSQSTFSLFLCFRNNTPPSSTFFYLFFKMSCPESDCGHSLCSIPLSETGNFSSPLSTEETLPMYVGSANSAQIPDGCISKRFFASPSPAPLLGSNDSCSLGPDSKPCTCLHVVARQKKIEIIARRTSLALELLDSHFSSMGIMEASLSKMAKDNEVIYTHLEELSKEVLLLKPSPRIIPTSISNSIVESSPFKRAAALDLECGTPPPLTHHQLLGGFMDRPGLGRVEKPLLKRCQTPTPLSLPSHQATNGGMGTYLNL